MAKRPHVTKTINPLHFEDLEPHRFEDLVRRLLSDEGFDVRAWEKANVVTNINEEGEEEGSRSLDGQRSARRSPRENEATSEGK
jgi:hypothetical protein